MRDAAAAGLRGNRIMLLGGLTASDTSRTEIRIARPSGDRAAGNLPIALHDTAAVRLGRAVYLFGGGTGANTQNDVILRIPATGGSATVAGHLPAPSSDQSAAAINGTAYIVGGFTGSRWLNAIVAWRPGAQARVVARLPFAVRYAAVASVGGRLVIAGGSLENSTASEAVLAYTPGRRVVRIGRLPAPTTHAAAATIGEIVYVIGGRGANLGSLTARIVAVDLMTGHITRVGTLTSPRSDLAAVGLGARILLAGGRGPTGTESTLSELRAGHAAKTARGGAAAEAADGPCRRPRSLDRRSRHQSPPPQPDSRTRSLRNDRRARARAGRRVGVYRARIALRPGSRSLSSATLTGSPTRTRPGLTTSP